MFVWFEMSRALVIALDINRQVSFMVKTPKAGYPIEYTKKVGMDLETFRLSKELNNTVVGDIYKEVASKEMKYKAQFTEKMNDISPLGLNVFFAHNLLEKHLQKHIGNGKLYVNVKDYNSKSEAEGILEEMGNMKMDVTVVPESLAVAMYLLNQYKMSEVEILNFRGRFAVLSKFKVEEKEGDGKKIIKLESRKTVGDMSDFKVEEIIDIFIKKAVFKATGDFNITCLPHTNTEMKAYCDILPVRQQIINYLNLGNKKYTHNGLDWFEKKDKKGTIPELTFDLDVIRAKIERKRSNLILNEKTFVLSNFSFMDKYNSIEGVMVSGTPIIHGMLLEPEYEVQKDELLIERKFKHFTGEFLNFYSKLQVMKRAHVLCEAVNNSVLEYDYIDHEKESYKKFMVFAEENRTKMMKSFEKANEFIGLHKIVENEDLEIKGKFIMKETQLKMLRKTMEEATALSIDVKEYEKFLSKKESDPQAGVEIKGKNFELKMKVNKKKKENEEDKKVEEKEGKEEDTFEGSNTLEDIQKKVQDMIKKQGIDDKLKRLFGNKEDVTEEDRNKVEKMLEAAQKEQDENEEEPKEKKTPKRDEL
ncbi:hypothetical protein ECANGB1_2282 [Enterospora canceri]|uniref:Uncharacterized protein n=1 Tax=Enterospora canceri TaxID=1081671 RepID=A0A1Y1S4U1_9MICR|nr:hypothetical protein ECANGB1_2282 [Enterospora canceri]